ncbi:hypothetical protein GGI21_001376 [Coemansia aciculifera]|uniref:Uncharacterized protein n=1 Tax=Coemansia aciculifera TaxID=417176 RepID=A0ACC1MBG5_9FUNG|nr:hypothetical protein IWW38_000253 [Coemansia aciculifera]KAJ2909940.1 hypothetical protein GGI21_001376 [Coemansia aciculifera]
MSDDEVAGGAKTSFSSILMSLFAGSTDRDFKVYTPIGDINDYDEDEEERRRDYISRTVECANGLADAIKNVHIQEDSLGKSIVKVALAIGKAYRVDSIELHASSESDSNSEISTVDPSMLPSDRERLCVALPLLHNSSEAYYWGTKEVSLWKEYHFVDTMTEFCSMVDGVKDVMNHSTQMLILYEKTMQMYQSCESRANSLRIQYPSDTPSVKYANEQEVQAGREMELAHQDYTDACDMANGEMIRYERERAQGMCKALENTAAVELESARARCLELRALSRRIRGAQLVKDPPHPRTNIGPMLWHAAALHPAMLTPSSLTLSASSSSLSATFTRMSLPDRATTFNDQLMFNSLTPSRSAHRYTNSSGGGISIGNGSSSFDAQGSSSSRRAHTMDNADFARSASGSDSEHNHSVFMETEEDVQYSLSASTSAAAPSTSTLTVLTPRKPNAAGANGSGNGLPQSRWNGRVSAMPFQGFDPSQLDSRQPHRIVVDQNRLAEMAAEAEMEAELVRSGMLAPRKSKSVVAGSSSVLPTPRSGGSGSSNSQQRRHQALSAFRPPPLLSSTSPGSNAMAAPSGSQLRHAHSHTGLSSIVPMVSPSEYLQYSRQTLHTSLSQQTSHGSLRSSGSRSAGPSSSRSKAGSSTAIAGPRSIVAQQQQQQQRRDNKGKGRAFVV